jgi:hypothetical protein
VLEGGGIGQRRRRLVDLVDLQVGPDRRFEFRARLLELAHGAAERAAELRQVLGSEDEKGDHEDEDEFLEANVEHDGFR